MNTIEIKDFIPFPGNYFSYLFDQKNFLFEVGDVLSLKSGDFHLPISLKVIQKIILENEVKAQLQTLSTHEASNLDQSISLGDKDHFKTLLQAWDTEEFNRPNNHYFNEMDKTNSKQKFIQLVGGCLSRPYKYPFCHKEEAKKGVELRVELLSLTELDKQLNYMEKIIRTETK